jgi:DNA-directed RNA polymerase subunit RPC12/RpoP
MTIDFTCQKCDSSFDLEASEIIEGEKIVCPHCDAKAPTNVAEDFAAALGELITQSQALSRKFPLSFSFDSEEAAVAADEEEEDKDDAEDDETEEDEDEEVDDEDGDEGRF